MDALSYLLGKKAGGGSSGALVPIVVEELPQTGEAGKLYLVPRQTSETNNVFDEYIYINDSWELIGTAEIDLSGKQDLITNANKLDASLVDDSLSTNKFVTSTEKTAWSGKQDLLTAGSNIEITNNVISANIPNEYVYDIEDNSQDNPFILSEHKTGIYYFNSRQHDGGYDVYFKVKKNGTAQDVSTAVYIYPGSYFAYYNQVEEDETFSSTKQVGFVWSNYVYKSQRRLYYGNISIQVNNQGRIYIYGQFASNVLSFINLAETISAKKTFSVLPESSIVPTSDDQLVNKKYVDDNAGGESSNLIVVDGTSLSLKLDGSGTNRDWINANDLAIWRPIWQKIKEKIDNGEKNFLLYLKTANSSIYPQYIGYDYSNVLFMSSVIDLSGSQYRFKSVDFIVPSADYNVLPFKYWLMFAVDNNGILTSVSCNKINYISFLATNNSISYTPTSNYNPATKKYVDDLLKNYSGYDATKTQVLKNVNGTFTWVDE